MSAENSILIEHFLWNAQNDNNDDNNNENDNNNAGTRELRRFPYKILAMSCWFLMQPL